MHIDLVRYMDHHIVDILDQGVRASDEEEVHLATGYSCGIVLPEFVKVSEEVYTVLGGGVPIALYGVAPFKDKDTGSPWLIGTDKFSEYQIAIALWSREAVKDLKKKYRLLENFVYNNNKRSIKWLQWCGFVIEEPEPFGPFGALFRRFWMKG